MRIGRFDRWWAALEAACVYSAILLYIWRFRSLWAPSWIFILAAVLVSHRLRNENLRELGFRITRLKAPLDAVLPVLLAVNLALLAGGAFLGTMQRVAPERAAANFFLYLPWALLQQYLLNGYFMNRLSRLFPAERDGRSAICAALLFAGAHIPNLFLVLTSFTGGYICARLYLRHKNLYLLGIIHGVTAFTLHLVVPDSIGHGFLVGPGYFRGQ